MPQSTTLNYLSGDHLGSTSLAVNASTGEVVTTRYNPWGEVRWTSENKTLPTRYTYTGQYSYISDSATDLTASASFGLMFYNARWYDPMLGRFAQADSVVPGGVQGLDRYAYANNNPTNYNDPTGHWVVEDPGSKQGCSDPNYCENGKPRSPEDIKLIQSTVKIRWGLTNTEGVDRGRGGLGTVVDDLGTIVTANHILKTVQEDADRECGCEVTFIQIFYNGEWHKIAIGDLSLSSSGDALTITLPENETLPDSFVPATPGESYQPQKGQPIRTVYQDEHENLHVATTTLASPITFPMPSPNGPVWYFNNPGGILNGGDSGGGVFYNGQVVGVNSAVSIYSPILWIAPYK